MTTRRHWSPSCARQAGPGELLAHHRERAGRDREVERVVAAGAADPVEVRRRSAPGGRTRRRRRSCPARTGTPRRAGPRRSAGTGCGRARWTASWTTWPKSSVVPVAAGEPGEREARRQQAAVGQVVDRRHQLLAGQVAGDAEDHQTARPRDPRQPLVARVPQRVDVTRPSRRSCDLQCGCGSTLDGALIAARCRRRRSDGIRVGDAGPGRQAGRRQCLARRRRAGP